MATPSITQGQIALDPINRIFYYLDSDGTLVNSSLNLLQESNTSITTEENLTVNNITVLGTTTVIDSTVTTIKDPIITLGGKTAPTVDDNKDRGIEFRWYDSSLATPAAKLGFFGFDDSSGKFTFIPDATNASEVFSGTIGELAAKIDWDNILNKPTFVNSITGTPNEIDVTATTGNIVISLPATGAMNITGTAAGWTTPRKITLGGDLEGNVLIDGGANVTLNAYVVANAVLLGTDTTGDYVASLIAGTGITLTNNSGEQTQPTIAVTTNTYDAYGAASAAESNAATDASTKAANAYNNATTYVNNQLSSFDVDDLADVTINTSLANSYLKYNGSAWVNDQIDLGTDTTGNYVQALVAGTGILISNNSGEGTNPTIALNADLNDISNVAIAAETLVADQVLIWDGSDWVNGSAPPTADGYDHTAVIGDGINNEYTIPFPFIEEDLFVTIQSATPPYEVINARWEIPSTGNLKVDFSYIPPVNSVKVTAFTSVSSTTIKVPLLGTLEDVTYVGNGHAPGDVLFSDGTNWYNHPLALNDLTDVQGTNSAVANQFLKYNGSAWVGSTISEINNINDVSDVAITSAANGQFLQYNGSAWVNSTLPTNEPTGHENKDNSQISFNNSNRRFYIQPGGINSAASHVIWCAGKKFVKSANEYVEIPNTTGIYYIYYNSSGTLSYKTSFFDLENEAPISYIYWNSTVAEAVFFADERHGITMDWATHEYLHRTRGAAIASGFGASGYVLGGDGTSDTHAQMSLVGGTFYDEDLQVDILHSATPTSDTWEQRLENGAYIPVYYHSGSNGGWIKDTATQFPLKYNARAKYNQYTGGSWTTTDIDNNRWGVSWIVATNNLNEPVLAILGQNSYTSTNNAEDATWEDLNLDGFPIFEFRPLYKIIYYTSNTYTNTPKTSFISIWDLRRIISSGSAIPTTPVSDHGSMSGLADDDHINYLNVTRHDALDHTTALGSASITDLGDVAITGATPDQFLKWDGSNWINADIPQINTLDDVGDVSATGASANSVLVYNGSAWVSTIDPVIGGNLTANGNLITNGNLTVSGNLIVEGNTVTLNTETLTVEDKNIVMGSVTTDAAADGGGITLIGSTNKSISWTNSTSSWTSSENIDLASGKVIKINGTEVLSVTNYTGQAATVAANSVSPTVLQEGPARAGFRSQINAQTTTPYTLVATDLGKLITMNASTGMTLTIPANTSVPFTIGDRVDVVQIGTGALEIAAAPGVTVNATPGLKLRTQWSSATMVKINTDQWIVMGDLKA